MTKKNGQYLAVEEIKKQLYEISTMIQALPIDSSAKENSIKILREHCNSAIAALLAYAER